ncbi:DNA-binding LacI/PurR family transcriptional regulator [Nonomuraea thailandensis]|uniref:DNA-binding LacI/PurR family transcriptional regulator n=1 Tax=Nonomuraea thailandensis TaxID=1188745 RepID=A0A9X2GTR1_9ACTN|nr:LacI family DNA-binding transcriptional regulator [Nonomuraea thailandensis]MCP2363702.1 DNA-binding LacI/PurR family transcriptional regulator [Nonomuraea thailandensis]
MKRLTISDIAERAGVSIGAVSFALNGRPGVSEATRQRILAIAAEMGWRPNAAARGLSESRAHTVGLVLARSADTLGVEPFFMKFIAGVESELALTRTALLLQVVPDHARSIEAVNDWWAERRVDGLIVMDLWARDARLPVLESMGLPAVLVGRPRPGGMPARWSAVWSDDAAAVTEAVDFLVGLGHRRIARVAGLPALEHTQVRTAAFHAAMERHGLSPVAVVDTDYTWAAGARATRELLAAADRPTAITYDNDVMATAGVSVARQLGVGVPQELSIVAGDDSQLCEMVFPTLTALSRDVQAYGVHTARTLVSLLDGGSPGSFQDTTARLVARESTGPNLI